MEAVPKLNHLSLEGGQYGRISERFFQATHSVLTGESDVETAYSYLELEIEDVLED